MSCGDKSFKYDMPVGEAIDLGLSVKWASFNIGASKPEGYGNYYAWGETDTKTEYNYSTYKYCINSYTKMTKYCSSSRYGYNDFVDYRVRLDSDDDVASVLWGGKWRMPTKEEFTELIDNCTWKWITRNGVNGYLVSSQKSGYEGASIFLPAAGSKNETGLVNVGSRGDYWSSSLYMGYSYSYLAHAVFFGSSSCPSSADGGTDRYHGFSVRPVCP